MHSEALLFTEFTSLDFKNLSYVVKIEFLIFLKKFEGTAMQFKKL